ncbi:MAG: nickel-dependent hydrogenase large subunit [Clostridiales bacterium]
MAKIYIDPITRIEGHLKLEVTVDDSNLVTDSKLSGTLFRDFENLLVSRPPKDAVFITQRICGVCPVPHAVASVKSIENSANYIPNLQALMLRNIIQGSNFIDSNILHFYHLSIMDYIDGPELSPWRSSYSMDLRFSKTETQSLINNYLTALKIRRIAHELSANIAGRLPHVASITPGGVTSKPTSTDINNMKTRLNEIKGFVEDTYHNDVNLLIDRYNDYYSIGKGYENLISFGVFDEDRSGTQLFPAGTYSNGLKRSFSELSINEDVDYSYYSSQTGLHPSDGLTAPSYNKSGAYTWLKSPRYNNVPYEAGPLARLMISGDYSNGVSVIDRHYARYLETLKIINSMDTWINQLSVDANAYENIGTITSGSGVGLTEAPRGALGHWLTTSNSQISNYQIITPTCWNASPKDNSGNFGPMENALIGTFVEDITKPIELMRIVHSFDPCTGCSVHLISKEGEELSDFVVELGI